MKVAIIGAGRLGLAIVETFVGGGNEITLIDLNDKAISEAANRYDVFTICADAKNPEMLRSLPVNEYDLTIAATSNDELNLVIGSFAKKLGCGKVFARVRDPQYVGADGFIKEVTGIDLLINPDMACAEAILKFLTEQYSIEGGRIRIGGASVLELPIEKKPELKDLMIKDARAQLGTMLVAAISREGKIMIPTGSTTLLEGDVLYLLGAEDDVNKLAPVISDSKNRTDVKRVMIAGGGNTGYFLAKSLCEKNLGVKIIEKNRARAEYLSGEINNVLILNGDATDENLLQEENLSSMDAFVAITGSDEQNLLLSMIAKQNGVETIAAKVSRKTYSQLTEKMDVAMTINPMDMCAAYIMHYARKEGVVLHNQMINGQAEFIEFYAKGSMPITDKTLAELEIPEGIIIAAVHRNHQLIIPNGSTKIVPGDRVTILSLLSSSAALEGMLSGAKASVL